MHPPPFSFKSPEFKSLGKVLGLGKTLGTGAFSAVFDNGDNTVTKITTDHAWLDYAEHCAKLPNCIRGARVARDALQCNGVILSVARMPKYVAPISSSDAGREAVAIRKLRVGAQSLLMSSIGSKSEKGGKTPLSARLLRSMASLTLHRDHSATLIGLAKFVETHPLGQHLVLDLHHKNFMVDADAGRLVITDPFNLAQPRRTVSTPPTSAHDSVIW